MSTKNDISKAVISYGIEGEIYAVQGYSDDTTKEHYQEGVMSTMDIDECGKFFGNKGWVQNGSKDNVPDLLHDLAKRSSIHKSCLNVKSSLIAGGGLDFEPMTEKCELNTSGLWEFSPLNFTDTDFEQEKLKARSLAKNALFHKYINDASYNIGWYGGYYGIRGFYRNTNGDAALRRVWIHDYRNSRLSVKRDWIDDGFKSVRHYFSENFMRAYMGTGGMVSYRKMAESIGTGKNKMTTLQCDRGQAYENNTVGTYSSFHKRNDPSRTYYATADYETQDTLTYIGIDYLLGVDDLKSIQEGFSVDHIIVRIREPLPNPEDEKAKQKQEFDMLKGKLSGAGGNRSMITWVKPHKSDDGKVSAPETWKIIEIPHQNNAERRNILREERLLKILNGHGIVSGEIVGLPRLQNGSGFSSQSEYLIHAMEQLYWNKIEPLQKTIVDDLHHLLLREKIYVKPILKRSAAKFKVLTDKMIMWAYGKDEIRAMNGDGPMSEEVRQELSKVVMERIDQKQAA